MTVLTPHGFELALGRVPLTDMDRAWLLGLYRKAYGDTVEREALACRLREYANRDATGGFVYANVDDLLDAAEIAWRPRQEPAGQATPE
jgi:hypothetical protein